MNSIMLTKSLVSDILMCPSWIKSQLGTILGITSMSFVTLWLEDRGTEPKGILLALSLVYLGTLLPLLFKRSGAITSSLLLVSSLGMLVSLKLESLFGVSLCLFVSTIQSARDLFYVDLMEDYAHIAKRNALNITKVVAATMLVGVITTSVSTPLIGLFSSEYRSPYFVTLSLIGFALAGGLLFRKKADGSSVKVSDSRSPLPVSLHWLCSLSMIVNIVTFFVRFFVLPITLLQIAKEHGFEDSVLVVAGSLIGVMSVVGFLFRMNADDRHCRRDMYQGVGAVLVACLLVAVTNTLSQTHLLASTVMFMTGYAMLEVSSKVWTINFIALLRKQGEACGVTNEGYMAFARYKAAGGFLGFFIAYLLFGFVDMLNLTLMLVAFATITITAIVITTKDVKKATLGQP